MFGRNAKFESGAIVVNGSHIGSTHQCVHCGVHKLIVPGSGKKRGWCNYCNGFLCGNPPCMQGCTPFEATLDYQEAVNARHRKLADQLLRKYPNLRLFT